MGELKAEEPQGGKFSGLRCLPPLEVRPSSVAPDPAESRGAPPPPHVWARESTAPAQGNQSLSRELRASALCPGLEARFPARRREERGCGPVTGIEEGLSRSFSGCVGKSHFPRLLPGTLGNFPGCLCGQGWVTRGPRPGGAPCTPLWSWRWGPSPRTDRKVQNFRTYTLSWVGIWFLWPTQVSPARPAQTCANTATKDG